MDILKNKLTVLSLALFTLFAFTSCSNPASSDDDEEHLTPFGVALILNGVEVAVQENGEVTYADGDHLELEIGEETNLITLRWIAEDGDRFVPNTDEGYSLSWIVDNENVVEVEQHEEDGAWAFHIVGLSAGESDIQFQLFHNDHADFTSSPFEVHVEQAVSGMAVRDQAGNAVLSIDESGTITGSLELTTDETTEELTAVFLDEEGTEIDTGSDYELEWHVESGSEFVTIERSTSNPFAFTFTGTAQGQATLHFELLVEHGDHEDEGEEHGIAAYESPDITITVN
ncbi:hypothetical protein [Rhodohalobacter sp. 8-1]|uniref:hypothetical protein n=1 Tax=Rhodohalobacter sp. 8-1 TaxID=3131972 RepID=UPI0030EF99CF